MGDSRRLSIIWYICVIYYRSTYVVLLFGRRCSAVRDLCGAVRFLAMGAIDVFFVMHNYINWRWSILF